MGEFVPLSSEIEEIAKEIVDACYQVHKNLGPGLLESAYELCLAHELRCREIEVDVQRPLPVVYKGTRLEGGYRVDLLVEDSVVIELKAVEEMHPLFEAQLLTYLKLSGKRLGFLVNFNVARIKDGIKRMIL